MRRYTIANFRRGVFSFLVGRLATGMLGFANFALLARVLQVENYATYVGLIAALELALAFSALGIDWVGLRHIPAYRENSEHRQFVGFVNRLLVARFAAALLVAILLFLISYPLMGWLKSEHLWQIVAWYIGIVFLCEALWRFICGVVFDSLLMQAYAQVVQFARSLTLTLGLLLWVNAEPTGQLRQVVLIECGAAILASLLALAFYAKTLLFQREQRKPDGDAIVNWRAPTEGQLWQTAWHNYSSTLVSHVYSPQAMQIVANTFLAPASAAAFGFARNLVDLIRRYIPSELFTSLLRPMLLARYARTGDFPSLNRSVMSTYKVSALLVVPVLLLFTTFGAQLLTLISAGKYSDSYPLVVVLLIITLSWAHRRWLPLVVNAVDALRLWSVASIACLIVLPLAIVAAQTSLGVYGILAAMAAEELLSTALIVTGLRRFGVAYRLDFAFVGKMLAAGAAAGLIFVATGTQSFISLGQLSRACCALLAFCAAACWLRPFDDTEMPMFRKLMGRVDG